MRVVSYTSDGVKVHDNVASMGLVCEAHPDREFGHNDCSGPGAPLSYRRQVLTELLRDVRIAAVFGDPAAALWLSKRGIDVRPGDDL